MRRKFVWSTTNISSALIVVLTVFLAGLACQGEQGQLGRAGRAGDRGIEGTQGPSGIQGDRGEKGESGERGEKGNRGDPGTSGTRGAQGSQGEKGDKGESGSIGPKGDKGDKGDTGERGNNSIFEIAHQSDPKESKLTRAPQTIVELKEVQVAKNTSVLVFVEGEIKSGQPDLSELPVEVAININSSRRGEANGYKSRTIQPYASDKDAGHWFSFSHEYETGGNDRATFELQIKYSPANFRVEDIADWHMIADGTITVIHTPNDN